MRLDTLSPERSLLLHAFNQKNARRIMHLRTEEHSNDKTEDAVTSMVFSPFEFMTPVEALTCLAGFIDPNYLKALSGRIPIRHHFSLWPGGLRATGWDEDGPTRCEPDLLVRFEFADGPPLAFIGEMKWDWRMPRADLARELRREKSAVAAAYPNDDLIAFVIALHRPAREIEGAPVMTWADVAQRLIGLERRDLCRASSRWAALVRLFLSKAGQAAFAGVPKPISFDSRWTRRPVLWGNRS